MYQLHLWRLNRGSKNTSTRCIDTDTNVERADADHGVGQANTNGVADAFAHTNAIGHVNYAVLGF